MTDTALATTDVAGSDGPSAVEVHPPRVRPWLRRLKDQIFAVQTAVFVAITGAAIGAALAPLRVAGWPFNHEVASFKYRTEIYAAHLARGDLFPLWSTGDGLGFGTPMPFYYHRVFYYVSGGLSLLGFSSKDTLALTLAFFLFVGAVGMRVLLRATGVNRPVLLVAIPALFVLSNYAFTDWLIRGAMAELSALMVVPFLLRWAVILVRENRVSYSLIPAFILLFYSHNVIALFGLFGCLVAAAVYLRRVPARWRNGERLRTELVRCTVIAGSLLVVFAPYVLLTRAFNHDYNVGVIAAGRYLPTANFQPAAKYVYDNQFVWLDERTFAGPMNLQVGYPILALCAVALGYYLARWIRHDRHRETGGRYPVVVFIVISLIVYTVLQRPVSAPLYESVRPLQFIQFPWRLLAFLTPLGLLLAALLLNDLWQVQWRHRRTLGAVTLTATVAVAIGSTPLPHLFNDHNRHLPTAMINERFAGTDQTRLPPGRMSFAGEYLPLVQRADGQPVPWNTTVQDYFRTTAGIDVTRQEPAPIAAGCTVRASPTTFEAASRRYTFDCQQATIAVLPLNFSRLHKVYVTRSDANPPSRTRITVTRTPRQPTIEVPLAAGQTQLDVVFPSMASLIFGG